MWRNFPDGFWRWPRLPERGSLRHAGYCTCCGHGGCGRHFLPIDGTRVPQMTHMLMTEWDRAAICFLSWRIRLRVVRAGPDEPMAPLLPAGSPDFGFMAGII
jgi:hypothetical protein